MDYLAQYYKNLCEQLQDKISLLESQLNEAGMQKALRSKDPEKIEKEKQKQTIKAEEAQEKYTQAGDIYKKTLDPKAAFKMSVEAQKLKSHEQNIQDLTPDIFDTDDPGEKASAEEVQFAQKIKQMAGK